jgi:hypothetical protein
MNRAGEQKTHLILLLVVLAIAAAMRFINFDGFSLSNDELSALVRLQYDSFRELVDEGFYVDGHPGGIQVFLFYWVKIFGDSEAALRFPFVIMGVLAVLFAWLTTKAWFGPTSAIFVAAAIAILDFPLLYSQIARPYGSGLFFTMFTAYWWTMLVFYFDKYEKRKYLDVAMYILGTSLMMYNHYFSFLLALIIGITGLFFIRKGNIWYYLGAGVACVLLFSPHIYITVNHLSIGGVGLWLGKPAWSWPVQHLQFIFNDSGWLLAVALIISLTGFLSAAKSGCREKTFRIIALAWFLLPLLTGFFYSLWVNPVLQHSVLIFSFPFLVMFLFSFSFWKMDKTRAVMLAVFAGLAFATTVFVNNYYSRQHFGEFKDVAARIVEWDNKYGSDNITRAISINNPFYIEYYLKRLNANPEFKQYDNRGGRDLFELKSILENTETPFFAYAWLKPIPYETHDLIAYYFPHVVEYVDYSGLTEVTLFAREAGDFTGQPQAAFSVSSNFGPGRLWRMTEHMLDSTNYFSGRYSLRMNPETEFGPTFEAAAGDAHLFEGGTVKVRAMIFTELESSQALIVFSLEQWDSPVYMWLASSVSNYAVPGEWSPVFFTIPVKELKSSRDILKVYIWNPGKENLYVDDIVIEVFRP